MFRLTVVAFSLLILTGCREGKKIPNPKLNNGKPPVVDYMEENQRLYEEQSLSDAAAEDHKKWCYGEHPLQSGSEIPAKHEQSTRELNKRIAEIRKKYLH